MNTEERKFWIEQLAMSDDANYRLLSLLEFYVDFINEEGLNDQFNEFLQIKQLQQQNKMN